MSNTQDKGAQAGEAPTIFEQIGGEPAIQAAVETFYRKVLADDRIAHFFDDVDMEGQIAKQKGFFVMATGGPNSYTGKDMREGHKHLIERGLNDSHVDAVVEHLGATLNELGVPSNLVEQVLTKVEGLRDDVLNR